MTTIQTRAVSDHHRLPTTTPGKALQKWQLPPMPLKSATSSARRGQAQPSLTELGKLAESRLSSAKNRHAKTKIELSLIDWLYETIRLNIKRGRLFEIDRVLSQAQADCLGYAKLFQQLGKKFGLDTGIVEVLIDNAGRPVPHVANIVTLSDGHIRFIDLWYGSKNVRHRRIGLMAKQEGRWHIVDTNWRELCHFMHAKGLPPRCVDAITSYMVGNRHLEHGIRLSDRNEFDDAIRYYTAAIALYPQNARLYFNRAVAHENVGNTRAAEADYAVALRDEASLIRVQARQHDEVVRLMSLDQIAVNARDQEIYLLAKGFVTGSAISLQRVAAKYRLSADEVGKITSRVESELLSMALPSPDRKTPVG